MHLCPTLISIALGRLFAPADGWQDALRRELEGTTVHFIDEAWSKPHAVLVDLHQIPEKHRVVREKKKYYSALLKMYVAGCSCFGRLLGVGSRAASS